MGKHTCSKWKATLWAHHLPSTIPPVHSLPPLLCIPPLHDGSSNKNLFHLSTISVPSQWVMGWEGGEEGCPGPPPQSLSLPSLPSPHPTYICSSLFLPTLFIGSKILK
eukprot:Sspe_Gene.114894::Locus_101219_Transcript_1_1_Confidence_1.000_Length_388::g.114894::m.114894